ncbi:glycosyltransferase family 2 protein [Clostridium fessum]|uniref:tetratricopeptide repeat-containing glycosyltransferase family 2 protein n=1 Tax=Clostridium fessum TaxID=2126740 RepID=UPI002A83D815|nr:glycosyltransferase family 2 protein [Clostridium fessum]MDY4928232.1 glycosyltransferase family 2 protein [Clostridium fessum]
MIRLSLCMIVKNEEAVLTRVLTSAIQFADEILVADTGSTDRTVEIARQYTKHIYHYPWNDDFAAARNFICEKVSTEYWIWLDADDIVPAESITAILKLKETLSKSPQPDVVMMKYVAGFQPDGTSAFTYNRERILRTDRHFRWKGRVHEAIAPRGRILYSPIQIEHRKPASALTHSDRNLKIYETMLADGELLDPRHQYYYARELIDHKQYEKARPVLEHFLNEPAGWYENKTDACLLLARCHEMLRNTTASQLSLFQSFLYDRPRAKTCCEIGRLKLSLGEISQAVFWYQLALKDRPEYHPNAFIEADYYDFIPLIQLCVCYDRMGNYDKALYYHKETKKIRPDSPAVLTNEKYFQTISSNHKTNGLPIL